MSHIHTTGTVPLKCNIVLQKCEQLKYMLIKGFDTHFAHKYSSQTKQDEYSWSATSFN